MLYVTYMVSEEKKAKGVSRRKFLAATGAGVAGIVVGGVVGSQLFPKVETTTATETATKTTTATTTTTSLIAKYPCPFCDKEFSSEAELGEHIKTAHAELITKEVEKPKELSYTQEISLNVNGNDYRLLVDNRQSLMEVLRDVLGFTGVKNGCDGRGECGACTVLADDKPVLSCLMLATEAQGMKIITIEGLADPATGALSELQQAFWEHGGFQCGYCTPGMIMLAEGFLAEVPHPTEEQVREAMAGNLCRCGSYDNIVKAILAFSSRSLRR
jgi:carbon-monoxide dehydrogenase small subunit